MQPDDIETLLQHDFDALAERLERDRFTQRLLFRLGAKRRARLGVVAFAGGLGAAFAASQFAGLGRLLAPFISNAPETVMTGGATAQIVGALLLATAAVATALVLRQDA